MDIGIPLCVTLCFTKERVVDRKTGRGTHGQRNIVPYPPWVRKADPMQRAMNLTNYKFGGLIMKIGFPPDVSLKFIKL